MPPEEDPAGDECCGDRGENDEAGTATNLRGVQVCGVSRVHDRGSSRGVVSEHNCTTPASIPPHPKDRNLSDFEQLCELVAKEGWGARLRTRAERETINQRPGKAKKRTTFWSKL